MENNRLISAEMEDMRSQIGILKEKLEKQTIINENHIRRSMKSKISSIRRTVLMTIIVGALAIPYCSLYFHYIGCSLIFVIATALILTVCMLLTVYQNIRLNRIDLSSNNIVDAAEMLGKFRRHYNEWHKVAIAIIIPWFLWCIYEFYTVFPERHAIYFCAAGLIGGLIGGFIGNRINKKIVGKADDILADIDELKNGK